MAEGGKTPVKLSILRQSSIVQDGDPCIYRVPMDQTVRDEDAGLVKLEFGHNHEYVVSKVIMMVGETGSGKTTLTNALANFVLRTEWDDPFRFQITVEDRQADQAETRSGNVTSYTLHRQEGMPYSLTVIDTPGFSHTESVKSGGEIVEQLRKFFTTPGDLGISHIDAIGFVVKASQTRLSVQQKHVFDSILALFGRDICNNIFLMVTFADYQEPEVLSVVREAEVRYKNYFQFNNSALYCQTDRKREIDCRFWYMGYDSFTMFLDMILEVESKSLVHTKNFLEERKRIEVYIKGIQREMKVGLSKLNTLEKEKEMLRKHEHDVEENKNFSFEVEEHVFEKKDRNKYGFRYDFMRNCKTCERTCCYRCMGYYITGGDEWCYAMDKAMACTVCPLHCSFAEHEICDFVYGVTRKKTKKSLDEIRLRYEETNGKKLSAQNIIDKIQGEYDLRQKKILEMANSVRKCLERVREIAFKPDPLSTVEYIDTMIKDEQRETKVGWLERIEQLNQLRRMAE